MFPEGFTEGTCGVTKQMIPGRNQNPEREINPVQARLSLVFKSVSWDDVVAILFYRHEGSGMLYQERALLTRLGTGLASSQSQVEVPQPEGSHS